MPTYIFVLDRDKDGKETESRVAETKFDGSLRSTFKCRLSSKILARPIVTGTHLRQHEVVPCQAQITINLILVRLSSFFTLEDAAFDLGRFDIAAVAASEALQRAEFIETILLSGQSLDESSLNAEVSILSLGLETSLRKKMLTASSNEIKQAYSRILADILAVKTKPVSLFQSIEIVQMYSRTIMFDSFYRAGKLNNDNQSLHFEAGSKIGTSGVILSRSGTSDIRKFQLENGLRRTGMLDSKTLSVAVGADFYPTIKRAYYLNETATSREKEGDPKAQATGWNQLPEAKILLERQSSQIFVPRARRAD